MQYNDDFDEEEMYGNAGEKRRLEVSQKSAKKWNSRSKGREVEKEEMGP